MYLLSCWYRRCKFPEVYPSYVLCVLSHVCLKTTDEVQKRFSVFYGVGCVASALAGILAYGLMQMDGAHGIAGWRWILILEGVVRCSVHSFYGEGLTWPDNCGLEFSLLSPDRGFPGQGLAQLEIPY
jgi:MFS family permease